VMVASGSLLVGGIGRSGGTDWRGVWGACGGSFDWVLDVVVLWTWLVCGEGLLGRECLSVWVLAQIAQVLLD
jgi:hypothetical protein